MENYLDNIFIGIFDDDEDKFSPSFEDLNLRCINNSCEGREREILEALLINCYNKNNSCACQSGLCPQLTKYNNKVRFCPCERSECVVKEGGCPCTLGSVCRGRKSYADECIPAILCLMNAHFEVTMDVIHQHVCSGITELRNFCKKILNEFSSNCQDVLKKEQVEGFCGLIKDLHGMKRTDEDGQLLIEKEERSSLFAKPQNEESKIRADPKFLPTNLDLAILTQAGMPHMMKLLTLNVPGDFEVNKKNMNKFEDLHSRWIDASAEVSAVQFALLMNKIYWLFIDNLGGTEDLDITLERFGEAVVPYLNINNLIPHEVTMPLWSQCCEAYKQFRIYNKSVGIALAVKEANSWEVIMVLENSNQWSFPKGQMEFSEDAMATGIRELREEVGFNLVPKDQQELVGITSGRGTLYYLRIAAKPEYHNVPDGKELKAIE